MFRILLLIFILVPAIEVGLFVSVGQYIGIPATIAIIFLTGLLGAFLAKREGTETLKKIRMQLANGQMPGDAVLDGACILLGGALLIAPGFLTDIAGFSLLLPLIRKVVKMWLKAKLYNKLKSGQFYIIRRPF
ncbi:FxsA family protein [Fictibacillus phosphorivorans]|uniref:FxsA family protein n=1 Tax=Fictibacillus phosphorivorans TaxID=1221500 RepID=UPI00203F106C|nr:FxsA family protein [Fictibacillus phosphorivorans]MCM3717917.1 membrane protein FxsA [Fictibacillus phosphorivorans]MCM3775366.1 membrane protein FxsA [Fictibacillus phosphorivorans]